MTIQYVTENNSTYEVITDNLGTVRWRLNNKVHRELGPAVIYYNGDQYWMHHGKIHRLDGPAVIYHDGYQQWYYQGDFVGKFNSVVEFEQFLKLKAFL